MSISTNTTSLEEILEAVNELPEYVEPITPETPTVTVSSGGLITATANGKSATKQLSTKAATTITPSTYSKPAVLSGYYTTGNVTVAGDTDLKAANIKKGVNIFGINGTYAGELRKFITNVTISGKYATSTYYDTNFGAQIGYINETDCVLMMRGGSSSSYEHIEFGKGEYPSEITFATIEQTYFWDGTSDVDGYLYAQIYRNFSTSKTYHIVIDMISRDSSTDSVRAEVNIYEN